jgi:hypothetical protein
MIGFTLLALFAPIVMRLPIEHYRNTIHSLELLEKQRISDWTYSEIKELLWKGSVPWNKLPGKGEPAIERPLSDITLYLPHVSEKTLQRSFTLRCTGEKAGRGGHLHRLYEMTVLLDQKPQCKYRMMFQLLAKNEENKA